MKSFAHISPPLRVHAGADALERLGREMVRLDLRRAAVICGGTISRCPLLDLVRETLGERYVGVFPGVRPHSPKASVQAAAEALREMEADSVVVVGGGSAVVTARAATILLAEGGDLDALSTSTDAEGRIHSPRLLKPKLPQLIVPTTPTTAIVKAGSAVHDPHGNRRRALYDPKTRAGALFIHPDLIMSAPKNLVISTTLDTLSAAVEGLISRYGDPIADALLIHAVRLLAGGLPRLAAEDGPDLRVKLLSAAVLCGRGTDHTGGGVATVLGHAIGAAHDIENGRVKAVVLPHALRFNAGCSTDATAKLAAALDLRPLGDMTEQIIEVLQRIFRELEVPPRLRDLRIPQEALPQIADRGTGDWFLRGNPRRIDGSTELLDVLEAAW